MLDIHENTIIKILTNRIENLEESKITSMQGEVNELQESIEFQNKLYKKIKKDMKEAKQKLETYNRNGEEVQNLIQQNTEMKEQIIELQHRTNMGEKRNKSESFSA